MAERSTIDRVKAAPDPNPGKSPGKSPGEPAARKPLPKEIGGVEGPEPTRYGDWEHKGRCTDF